MLTFEESETEGTLVVLMHWLGGSARTWTEVSGQLARRGFRCVAVDLPGFGQSQDRRDFSVAEMTNDVIETVRSLRMEQPNAPWLIAGHSMGGKIAALVANAAEQGQQGLANLKGVVLVSPSPLSPEPMKESKRKETIEALGPATKDLEQRRQHAAAFVDDNTGKLPLPSAIRMRSIDDVLQMNPDALTAWMTTGSKADYGGSVSVLNVPALVLAGETEEALGPSAQSKDTLPHFAKAKLVSLEGCGHLAPLERPWELSDRMAEFFEGLDLPTAVATNGMSEEFLGIIHSERTSPQTRSVLMERMEDDSESSSGMDAEELRTLRALAARVVPGASFDLAKRVDRALAQSKHDGWRFGALPEDVRAWKMGLASLNHAARRMFEVPFVALDADRQDELLKLAQKTKLGKGLLASLNVFDHQDLLNTEQMRVWFEDVRGELAKHYVADPRTMERIGFTGFADEAGFTKIKLEDQQGGQC